MTAAEPDDRPDHRPAAPPVAVVLAAGRGTRMQAAADVALTPEQAAAADAGLKFLVPIHGRPYLTYVLDEVAAAGFEDVVVVVTPEARVRAERAVGVDRRVDFALQPEPLGGADAVLAAEPAVGRRPFIVINADNIYPANVLGRLRELDGPGLIAFDRDALIRESNIPAERIAAFAVIRETDAPRDGAGLLSRILEKPSPETLAAMPDARVSMTCWRFDAHIFDACRDVAPSPRGELELTDAVALSIERGTRYRVVHAATGVLDISRRSDIPELEGRLAARSESTADPPLDPPAGAP